MLNQPLHTHSASALAEEQDEQPQSAPASRRGGPFRQLWKAWLWLTGPRPTRFGVGIVAQERLRRSRLISALLILVAIVIALLIPSTVKVPNLWQPVLIQAVLAVLAAIFNRAGQGTIGGVLIIALADLSITQNIVRQPYGLTNTTLADLYLLVIAILIAGMVLPNIFIPIIGAVQILICMSIFVKLPPHTLLTQEIQEVDGGQAYTAILGPILLQVCGTFIVWLYAWSVDRAILRASRAEELAEARARITEQARLLAEQKQRLEHGIHALQEVQARVSNGDYSARVSLQGNELLPLAVSFNIMAERLGHVAHIEQEHQRLERALQRLLDACTAIGRGLAPGALRPTGTLADRIFPSLTRLYQLAAQMAQGSALAEDLRAVMQRQHEHFAQLETRLVGAISIAKDLAIETVQAPHLPSGAITSAPLGRSQPLSGFFVQIGDLVDRQINLLDQAKTYCSQASDLGTRCTQGARILSQRLKEAG